MPKVMGRAVTREKPAARISVERASRPGKLSMVALR